MLREDIPTLFWRDKEGVYRSLLEKHRERSELGTADNEKRSKQQNEQCFHSGSSHVVVGITW
jgi:hypothetical protein